jgi:hypothetical protein
MNNPKNRGEIDKVEAEKMGAKLIVADYGADSSGDRVFPYSLFHYFRFVSFALLIPKQVL